MAKCYLRVGKKSRSEAWNGPTWCCKSILEGLVIMLEVFITLLYTYIIPNNHYCGKPSSLRCHLMAKCYLRVGKKSRSEAWNRPTWCCKSKAEWLTIMLGVFITLVYTYTMPNNHIIASLHLWGATWWPNVTWEWAKNRDLRQETGQHGAVKVWQRDLQSCWECSSLCYTPIKCQTTTTVASLHLWGATWWPNVTWEWAKNWDLRQETGQHGAVKVWQRDLQSCWECSSLWYTPLQCQTTTL